MRRREAWAMVFRVPEELDLFRAEGLYYEFQADGFAGGPRPQWPPLPLHPLRVHSGASRAGLTPHRKP